MLFEYIYIYFANTLVAVLSIEGSNFFPLAYAFKGIIGSSRDFFVSAQIGAFKAV